MFENFPHKRRTDGFVPSSLREFVRDVAQCQCIVYIHEGHKSFWRYRKYQSENREYARFVKFYITDTRI